MTACGCPNHGGRTRPALTHAAGMLLALGLATAPPALSQPSGDAPEPGTVDAARPAEFAAGHGAVFVEVQDLFANGDWWDRGPKRPFGSVITQSLRLGIDYFFADNWEVHASLPFVKAKYSGAYPHLLSTLEVPHPDTVFVEDGNWHGTWADWVLGVDYHTRLGSYYVTPSVRAYIPSHDYTFYGSATVGDRQNKLGIGVEVAHQFAFSNFYYTARVQHVFVEKALGINADYNIFGMDLGYFLNPRTGVRGFFEGKLGNGATSTEIIDACCSSEFWYLHDKFRIEDHLIVGGGVDYQLAENLGLSATVFRMVWGRDNLNLKYGVDLKLTRSF